MTINHKQYYLSKGDSIGFITPSSPMLSGRLEAGLKFIEENGFKAKLGKHIKDSNRFLAGSDQDRRALCLTNRCKSYSRCY